LGPGHLPFSGISSPKKGGETEASCGSEEPPGFPNCHCPKFLLLDRRSTRGTKGEVVDSLLTAGEPHRHIDTHRNSPIFSAIPPFILSFRRRPESHRTPLSKKPKK